MYMSIQRQTILTSRHTEFALYIADTVYASTVLYTCTKLHVHTCIYMYVHVHTDAQQKKAVPVCRKHTRNQAIK